jgi:hypothetical protein
MKKYELTTAAQEGRRVTRHLCIEAPAPLAEGELADLRHIAETSEYPKVALGNALAPCGGRAYWEERPRQEGAAQ